MLLAAVVVYLWPVLVGGKAFSTAAVLYDLPPFHLAAPPDLGEYRNLTVSDQTYEFLPWLEYAREAIRGGDLPGWNPFVLSGVPFFANPQAGVLSPFNVPAWILPLEYSLGARARTGRALRAEGWRRKLPFVLLGVVGPQAALGLPPFHRLIGTAPGLDSAWNTRLFWMFSLGVPILAAFAADRLLRRRGVAGPALAAVGAAIAVGLIAVLSVGPSLQEIRTTGNHFRTGTDYPAVPNVIHLTAIGWWLLLAVGVGIAAALRERLPAAAVAGGLLALVALDVGHFATGYQPMAPADRVPPAVQPSLAMLRSAAGSDRVFSNTLRPDSLMLWGLRDARGYDPPFPDMRYVRLWRQGGPDQALAAPIDYAFQPASEGLFRVMELLGVAWFLQEPTAPPFERDGFELAYSGAEAAVYRNRRAAQRARVPRRVVPVESEQAALETMFGPNFDPRSNAAVEHASDGRVPAAGAGDVRVVRDEESRVDLDVRMSRPGLVVLNDRLDRGWQVTVDGREAPELRVNSVMRGVEVPTGAHEVSWTYRVPGLRAGMLLGLLGALAIAALLLIDRRSQPAGSSTQSSRRPQ